jgi:hypothetical protein
MIGIEYRDTHDFTKDQREDDLPCSLFHCIKL